MNRLHRISGRRSFIKRSATLATGLAVAPAILTGCGTPEAEDDAPADDGFISLFDGETLDGWHTNPEPIGHGTGGLWTVEDGALVGQQDPPGSGNGGILLTDREFGDFELLIDMKPDWGPDSGVFLRATERGECFQVYVDYHDEGEIGQLYGEGTGAWRTEQFKINGVLEDEQLVGLSTEPFIPFEGYERYAPAYSCTPEEWLAAWKIGAWNTLRVRCVGAYPTISTWINGTKICGFDAATYQHPKYDKNQVAQVLERKGHIAVQVHGGHEWWPRGAKVRWKNIQLKEL